MALNEDATDRRTEKRQLGDLGENIATDFLKRKGFEIIERNYLRKWGEIDIIAKKSSSIYFIEVKSVSCVTLDTVTHGTIEKFKPEDNMHPWKLQRLLRTIQTYLFEKNLELDWQLDLITVEIDQQNKKARVKIIENIII